MTEKTTQGHTSRILTLPNILTLFRLLLIPVFMYLYIGRRAYAATAVLLLVSGATDVVDGWIARTFDLVTDIGKAIDPVADKLTQGAMLICLAFRYPLIWALVGIMAVKEVVTGAMRLAVVRKTGEVHGAVWYGKVTTVVLYLSLVTLTFWYNIPEKAATVLMLVCGALMIVSFVLYFVQNVGYLREARRAERADAPEDAPDMTETSEKA